jgi:hypothetical protein
VLLHANDVTKQEHLNDNLISAINVKELKAVFYARGEVHTPDTSTANDIVEMCPTAIYRSTARFVSEHVVQQLYAHHQATLRLLVQHFVMVVLQYSNNEKYTVCATDPYEQFMHAVLQKSCTFDYAELSLDN